MQVVQLPLVMRVLYLFRDSTEITMQGGNYGSGAGSDFGGHCLSVLDSPSTTSSVTYTVKLNQTSMVTMLGSILILAMSLEKKHI